MKVAIIGASGVLGRQVLTKLALLGEEQKITFDVTAVASKKSVGREVSFGEDQVLSLIPFETFLTTADRFDILISSLPAVVHKKWHDDLAKLADKVIDLSSAMSLDPDTLLVDEAGDQSSNCYAIPQSVTIAVDRLYRVFDTHFKGLLKRINITAMMAASENGKGAMDELYEQAKKAFVHQPLSMKHYDKQISFNLLPRHGEMMSDRQNHQEWLIRSECSKISKKAYDVGLTTVQAPIFIGTSLSMTLDFNDEVAPQDIIVKLQENEGFIVMDNKQFDTYATPLDVASSAQILISRVREDWSSDTALHIWACIDNLEVRSRAAIDVVEKLILQ